MYSSKIFPKNTGIKINTIWAVLILKKGRAHGEPFVQSKQIPHKLYSKILQNFVSESNQKTKDLPPREDKCLYLSISVRVENSEAHNPYFLLLSLRD